VGVRGVKRRKWDLNGNGGGNGGVRFGGGRRKLDGQHIYSDVDISFLFIHCEIGSFRSALLSFLVLRWNFLAIIHIRATSLSFVSFIQSYLHHIWFGLAGWLVGFVFGRDMGGTVEVGVG